jgi:monovalent cation:H+ antiporter-2, CPA2 family
MFGVGLHFSVRDLRAVYRIAVPGAIAQIAIASALGLAAGFAFGWTLGSAAVLGLAVSVASTVVLLRMLRRRGLTEALAGKVAVGWLIVEDLFTVLALVLLPVLAATSDSPPVTASTQGKLWFEVGSALGKAALLTALMLAIGSRVLPWLLLRVHGEGSRELFTLAVLGVGLGIAYTSTVVFDVSLALGAFLAGAVLSESRVSASASETVLPLSDVFAVLFFVSVGMLLDPAVLVSHPLQILVIVLIVVVGKSLAAVGIVALLRQPLQMGLTVAAGLAQIGEFSFIVATAARSLGLMPEEGFQMIVAVALISIAVNPLVFAAVAKQTTEVSSREPVAR